MPLNLSIFSQFRRIKKDYAGNDHTQCQPFKNIHDQRISHAVTFTGIQGLCKAAVISGDAIDDEFKDLDIDDDETQVKDQMKKCRNNSPEHFFLSKRQQENPFPAFSRMIIKLSGPAQPDGCPDHPDPFKQDESGGNKLPV
jgi:hypothetical protein